MEEQLGDQTLKLIGHWSRSLKHVERNYETNHLQFLSIVWEVCVVSTIVSRGHSLYRLYAPRFILLDNESLFRNHMSQVLALSPHGVRFLSPKSSLLQNSIP